MIEDISNGLFYICVSIVAFNVANTVHFEDFFKVIHKIELDNYMLVTLGYETVLIAIHKWTSCRKLHEFSYFGSLLYVCLMFQIISECNRNFMDKIIFRFLFGSASKRQLGLSHSCKVKLRVVRLKPRPPLCLLKAFVTISWYWEEKNGGGKCAALKKNLVWYRGH